MKKTDPYPVREWFEDGPFWRHNDSSNAGDLIFNTMDKDIRDKNISQEAHDRLEACSLLLKDRERWPKRLDVYNTSRTWIRYKWSKLLKNGKFSRPRHIMTRDPYIAFYANCIRLGRRDLIAEIKIPWYCYKPSTFVWRKYLITRDSKYLRRYRFWQRFSSNKHAYVRRLDELREFAIINI